MDQVPAETTDRILRLSDGRQLGYAEYGAQDGMPVLFFHSSLGSRHSIFADMAATTTQRGVRLVAPERPGYGLSGPLSGRLWRDWTTDVRALTTALGIDRFKLVGFSGGSPYALACAHALPAQVEQVALVGGFAPMSAAGGTAGMAAGLLSLFELAQSDPQALRETLAALATSPAALLEIMAASVPAVDQRLIASRRDSFEVDFAELLRGGIEGIARDFELIADAWPFPLAEIQARIALWSGTEDCNTPSAMSRHLASVLPHSRLLELPGEGHCCLYTHWDQILDQLISGI